MIGYMARDRERVNQGQHEGFVVYDRAEQRGQGVRRSRQDPRKMDTRDALGCPPSRQGGRYSSRRPPCEDRLPGI